MLTIISTSGPNQVTRLEMKNKRMTRMRPMQLAGAAAVLALSLSACGQADTPASTGSSSQSPAPSSTATDGGTVDQSAMLAVNEKLSTELGDGYVQGWIEGDTLHVSTTNEGDLKRIKDAGAIGHLVDFSSADLREGISKIMKWQAEQGAPIQSSIHSYMMNPKTGGLTLSVDPNQREEVEASLAKDKPAGDIPLDFKDSGGLGSPAPATMGG